jgi:holo-[acyl-carrier protein] synthase
MIHGIGTDIVEIERIKAAIDRHGSHFLDRLFTIEEQQYALSFANSEVTFAGRFAAKEAISKALGTGIGEELNWKEIQIINDGLGKPIVTLSNPKHKNLKVHLSISHSKTHAIAFALVE